MRAPFIALGLTVALLAVARGGDADEPTDRERLKQLQSLPYVAPPRSPGEQTRTGVLGVRREDVAPGVNFYATRFTNRAYVMTTEGKVLHEWTNKDKSSWLDAEVLPDGSLITLSAWDAARAVEFPGVKDFPSYITKLSRDSKVVWRHELDAHHEIQVLSGQRILTLLQRSRSLPAISRERKVMDNELAILSPAGAVLARRSLYDLLAPMQKRLPFLPVDAVVSNAIDLFHANSAHWVDDDLSKAVKTNRGKRIHPLHAAGTVLICIRHQDAVVAVSWETKKVLWTWGRGELQGPHAASLLPNGNVLVFDNGLVRGFSRVVEVDPTTNQIVWQYAAREPKDFYSGTGGYVQRLPNGNTLITNSWMYQGVEITPDKRMVWNWVSPERSFLYRIKRRPWTYFTREFGDYLRRESERAAGARAPAR